MAGRQTPLLDVTVICPLAYLQSATASAGAVAELAATRKVAKYSILEDQYTSSSPLLWSYLVQ